MGTSNFKKINYLAVACIILLLSVINFFCSSKPNEETRVVFVNGTAELRHQDGTAQQLAVKMLLQKGDTVVTGNGFVLVQIGDDILVRIQPDTTINITSLFEQSKTAFFLSNGQVISRIRKLSKDFNYSIKTPTAVASARGTQYSVSYYPGRSVVAVREGKVGVDVAKRAGEKQVMVTSGNSLVIDTGKGRSISVFENLEIEKMVELPYHSTSELARDDTFKIIGQAVAAREQDIDKKIADNGGPIPRTMEEMLKKYGFLNRVVLYSNKSYVGIVTSRRPETMIMTLDGIEVVPFNKIRKITRTTSIIK